MNVSVSRSTASDVAKRAGVSAMTVSRALSGKAPVAEETRRRIEQAVSELGYRPNWLAAGLRGSGTRSIGVIWAFVDPWSGDAGIGLDVLERIQHRGFVTYQAQQNEQVEVMCEHLDELLARRVDAIVIRATPRQLKDPQLRRRLDQAPGVVAVTRAPVEGFAGDLVVHDRDYAYREAVDYLARAGRKRIALAAEVAQESNAPKYEVFLERCRMHGIADHPYTLIDLGYPDNPDTQGQRYRDGFRRAFPGQVQVDAIICINDVGAMFTIHELQERGIRVPEDVAVVGFNNIETCRVVRPALASCDRRSRETAEAVDRMLAWRLDNPDAPPQCETIHMNFVHRASAG